MKKKKSVKKTGIRKNKITRRYELTGWLAMDNEEDEFFTLWRKKPRMDPTFRERFLSNETEDGAPVLPITSEDECSTMDVDLFKAVGLERGQTARVKITIERIMERADLDLD